jgi:hypothetical protein
MATTEVPPYGPPAYRFLLHFSPGDRTRMQIQDKVEMPGKPDDDDPCIVHRVLDPKLKKNRRPRNERRPLVRSIQ